MAFNLDDCVELLLNTRKEEFRHEYSIRLFQFQTWILYPTKRGNASRDVGRLAAAAILRSLEQKQVIGGLRRISFAKLQSVASAPGYRDIFDVFIAPQGGWSNLLFTTPASSQFNEWIKEHALGRIGAETYPKFVADVIHYRLRSALYPPEGPNRSGTSHAISFKWRQNPGAFTPRTAWKYWKIFHRAAAFMYLIQKHSFPMMVPDVEADFVKQLMHPAISKAQLKTFFAKYEFVVDTLGDEEFYALPEPVTPAPFKVARFSAEELGIINAYDPVGMGMRRKDLIQVDNSNRA
jgi:hypothetical protein